MGECGGGWLLVWGSWGEVCYLKYLFNVLKMGLCMFVSVSFNWSYGWLFSMYNSFLNCSLFLILS
jgi:hypothetical protein